MSNLQRMHQVFERWRAMDSGGRDGVFSRFTGHMNHRAKTSKAMWVGCVIQILEEAVEGEEEVRGRWEGGRS